MGVYIGEGSSLVRLKDLPTDRLRVSVSWEVDWNLDLTNSRAHSPFLNICLWFHYENYKHKNRDDISN